MQELRHVLWIGGGSRSGKTTIAKRLARRYGLRWYSADAQTWRHRDRAVAAGHPAALRFESLTLRGAREGHSPAELLEMGLHEERGPMIVDDLRELPTAPLVVAEGSTLPPFVVSTGVAAPGRAVWLIPTPRVRRGADRPAPRAGSRPPATSRDLAPGRRADRTRGRRARRALARRSTARATSTR